MGSNAGHTRSFESESAQPSPLALVLTLSTIAQASFCHCLAAWRPYDLMRRTSAVSDYAARGDAPGSINRCSSESRRLRCRTCLYSPPLDRPAANLALPGKRLASIIWAVYPTTLSGDQTVALDLTPTRRLASYWAGSPEQGRTRSLFTYIQPVSA